MSINMNMPKTFETFLAAVGGLLFYLAYQHTDSDKHFWLGVALGLFLVFISIVLYAWRISEYHDYLRRQLDKMLDMFSGLVTHSQAIVFGRAPVTLN